MRVKQVPLSSLVVIAVAGILGCALPVPSDPTSPYSRLPAGTEVRIAVRLAVPPGSTRVYLQRGEVVRRVDRYAANCNLEVRQIDSEVARTVDPGDYRVTQVQSTVEEVVRLEDMAGTQLAAAGGLRLSGIDDGGASTVYLGYHLWLDGPDPNVMRLSCRGAYADPAQALPPSINEIRNSLGSLITLTVIS